MLVLHCPYCGKKLPGSEPSEFCPYCGRALPENSETESPPQPADEKEIRTQRAYRTAAVLLSVFAALILCARIVNFLLGLPAVPGSGAPQAAAVSPAAEDESVQNAEAVGSSRWQEYDDDYLEVFLLYRSVSESGPGQSVYGGDSIGSLALGDMCRYSSFVPGYMYSDLDFDGIPELIIGSMNESAGSYWGNVVYGLYALNGDGPCTVLVSNADGRYSLTADGKLLYEGTTSAGARMFSVCEYTGHNIKCISSHEEGNSLSDFDTLLLSYLGQVSFLNLSNIEIAIPLNMG